MGNKMQSFLSALFLLCCLFGSTYAAEAQSAYDRVLRTGTLRCGYFLFPTALDINPNTKQMSGFYYDLMTEIGRELNLKIEWTEEVTVATMLNGLKDGRFDMLCTGPAEVPTRAREGLYTTPVLVAPVNIYVRADDKRFPDDADAFNKDSVTFAGLDGDSSSFIVQQDFPRAKLLALPDSTPPADRIMTMVTRKADAAVLETVVAGRYMATHPGKIKAALGKPYKAYPLGFVLPRGSYDLKFLMDSTIHNLNGTGFLAKLVRKYQSLPGDMLPPAPLYADPVTK